MEVVVQGISPALLSRIFQRRIEWARRSEDAVPTISNAALEALIAQYGDDLRMIEDVLYSVFQDLERPSEITAAHIEETPPPTFTPLER